MLKGVSSSTAAPPLPTATVPIVLRNTKRCRSASTATSSTPRSPSTFVRNKGAGSARWARVSTTQ
jgi:hypothetical protein